ncbi:MAG TPA: recombination mediator RecR [Phototrophicaceae bacterium]|nr:recombination mediator RecR [Phototrophicaceae bacterium]
MSNAVPEPVTKLIDALSRLPGVGSKTASRLTYYLLRSPDELSLTLADALRDLKSQTRLCSVCFNITVDDPCPICANDNRDHRTIAVVEEPLDVLAIERAGIYKGVYHVLHGAISPVNGILAEDLKIRELVERVDKGNILEVIVATNPGLEGDATARMIQRELVTKGVKLTWLARGLPVGGDIEYADSVTLMRALQGRSEL